jgi:glucose dehydrogenase
MPESWGSVTVSASLVTNSDLIFIGASMDARVRAIDLKTGDMLWQAPVDAPAVATPATRLQGNPVCRLRRRWHTAQQASQQVAAFALR